ncbi:MAG: hypothetical protein UT01_C0001G0017 [Candidatus Daviesbacteria bacterium GW2011_GWA1_38_7]|nr:MAG: hypothetical protein UT01_C0001G0017 [Candidatus Daviesbacteria bacterium GW2011_GWA1_38_7]
MGPSGFDMEGVSQKKDYFVGSICDYSGRRGWFMGHFMPPEQSLQQTDQVETAVMTLPVTDEAKPHFHRLGTEVTYCIRGSLRLLVGKPPREVRLDEGQFIIVPPGTPLQNPSNEAGTQVFVVKFPSIPQDKFYTE